MKFKRALCIDKLSEKDKDKKQKECHYTQKGEASHRYDLYTLSKSENTIKSMPLLNCKRTIADLDHQTVYSDCS